MAPTSALAASSDPACGHANVNNPGHHYGLIKNGCLPGPPPPPSPSPAAAPTPKTQPPPVVAATPHGTAVVPADTPAPSGGALDLRAAGDKGVLPQRTVSAGPAARDTNLWLVEALLPTLVIVWLMLLGGARSFEMRSATSEEQPG